MAKVPYSEYKAAAEDVANINRYSDTQDATLRTQLGGVAVTNELAPRTLMYASANMLRHAEPILILEKFAQAHPIPANKSQTIKMRRAKPFAAAKTPLVEGVTPDPQKMSYEDVEATLKQYGAWLELTDVIADTHEDPVLRDMSTLCGEQAGETKELLSWGVITGGTNVIYAGGAANRAAVAKALSLSDIRKATRTLRAQRTKPLTKMLSPSANIATRPVEAGFVAIGHSDLEADLRNMPGFIPVANYGSRSPLSEYEVGSVEGVRFLLSPMYEPLPDAGGAVADTVSSAGTKADVYQLMVFGADFFGAVPLKGKDSVKTYVLNPGQARGGDPLGQRGTVGWKTWFCAVILNQSWGVRLEAAASDLSAAATNPVAGNANP